MFHNVMVSIKLSMARNGHLQLLFVIQFAIVEQLRESTAPFPSSTMVWRTIAAAVLITTDCGVRWIQYMPLDGKTAKVNLSNVRHLT